MDDTIYRQEAIRLVHSVLYEMMVDAADTDIEKPMSKEDKLLFRVRKVVCTKLREMPSAQPVIIHCGDCKYKDDGIDEDGIPFLKCLNGRSYGGTRINDYCSWAERRIDESD